METRRERKHTKERKRTEGRKSRKMCVYASFTEAKMERKKGGGSRTVSALTHEKSLISQELSSKHGEESTKQLVSSLSSSAEPITASDVASFKASQEVICGLHPPTDADWKISHEPQPSPPPDTSRDDLLPSYSADDGGGGVAARFLEDNV